MGTTGALRARAAAVVVALAAILVPAARLSAAPPPDIGDVILADIGPGWELAGDTPGPKGSLVRMFSGGGGLLAISGFPVTNPPGSAPLMAAIAALRTDARQLAEPSLPNATWLVTGDSAAGADGNAELVLAARDHFFDIVWQGDPASFDGAALVLDVAGRQLAAAGGTTASGSTGGRRDPDDVALLQLIPAAPPAGFGLPPTGVDYAGADELPAASGVDDEVRDFLARRSHTGVRLWADTRLIVAVDLTRFPYDIFAAAGLATMTDRADITVDAPVAGVVDSRLYHIPGDSQTGVTFRRGDILVNILAGSIDADPQTVEALAIETARLVAAGLPAGGTGPYHFPSPPSKLAGLAVTAALVTISVGGATGVARLRARRLRRRWASTGPTTPAWPAPNAHGAVVHLDDDARSLRRRGAVVAGGQLLFVNVGIGALAGDFGWPGVAIAGVALIAGLEFTRWWLGRELSLLGPEGPRRTLMLPRLSGAAVGVLAVGVLAVGAAFLLKGIRYLILKPTLAQLRWSDLFGISPRAVGAIFAAGGLVVTALGAVVYRLARALGRAHVKQALAADPRPPALYLRSFDDDSLPLPVIASARRPLFELFSVRGADPFEEAIAWELHSYGPVVAVGRPGRGLASLGAAREHLSNDTWRQEVGRRMDEARVIAIAPGETDGLAWEVGEIVNGDHLAKTVFVFPPLAPAVLARRWEHTAAVLAAAGATVTSLPASPAVVHTAQLSADGSMRVTSAQRRDEATYRTAVDRALLTAPTAAATMTT